jgi:ketosteroid isomerase-like protein
LLLGLVTTLTFATACHEPRGPDLSAQRDSVTALLAARFSAFEQGRWDEWTRRMSDSVFLTAAEPGRALAGRDTILRAMQADYAPAFEAGLTTKLTPVRQQIWMDDSARVAAVTSELDYALNIQEQHLALKLRNTAVLSRDSAGWRVLVEHYSRPVAYDSLFTALVTRKVQAPAPLEQSVDPGAGELVEEFRRDLRDFAKAPMADSIVVVTPGEVVLGAALARKTLATWLGPPGNATTSSSGIRAGLAPSATTGWVATILFVPIFAGPESSVAPVRMLLVYHIAGDHWEIVEAHFSVGWSGKS